MHSYNVSDIKPDIFYSADLLIDNTFLLCAPPCRITGPMLSAVKKWGFTQIHSLGKIGLGAAQIRPINEPEFSEATLGSSVSISEENSVAVDASEFDISSDTEELSATEFTSTVNASEESAAIKMLANHAHKLKAEKKLTENSLVDIVQSLYNDFQNYITKVYTRYATHKEINLEEISDTVAYLCDYIQDFRRYVLRITPSLDARNRNFLISHSMRSTVLAITIGQQLHMSREKLVELGVAGILHEIGMIRLPPQTYMNDRPLAPSERSQMNTHPILSYNILKDANFPLGIQLGVLEHHERENGTGYPRHITGDTISLYAKIISVACSFEAITAPRHFKEAKTTYEAMIELLKNENHQYDDTVVKALLYSLSLFPIGAYVYLSNGKIAQVTDVAPDNPKNPIVTIIGETGNDGAPVTAQTDDNQLRIVRVMSKQESEDVLAALEKNTGAEKQDIS